MLVLSVKSVGGWRVGVVGGAGRYVRDRLLARSDDESQRMLAGVDAAARITSFAYVGHGHLTTADAFLAASAAARARDERRAAREALSDEHTWTTRGRMPAPEDAA